MLYLPEHSVMSMLCSNYQIIPFLALGLGVDDMFLIAHTFSENADKPHIDYMVTISLQH